VATSTRHLASTEQRAGIHSFQLEHFNTLPPYEDHGEKQEESGEAAKQPVAGVFGKVRKHVVPRTRA